MRFRNRAAQESLLGLVLFSTFICSIEKGMGSRISRFASDVKLFRELTCFATDNGLLKNFAKARGQKRQKDGCARECCRLVPEASESCLGLARVGGVLGWVSWLLPSSGWTNVSLL